MPTDPLTQEAEQSRETIKQLEDRILSQQAEEDRQVKDELDIASLEAQLLAEADAVAPPPLPDEEDGFLNNTWEVFGSAGEQAAEQIVRTVGDLSKAGEVKIENRFGRTGRFILGDSGFVTAEVEDRGIPIWPGKRLAYVGPEEFDALELNYAIATGETAATLSDFELPDVDRPDSVAGQMTSGFAQWAIGFAATRKSLGTGVISSSIIADFAVFDPHEARLSDLLSTWGEGNPVFDNAVTEYLSADVTDSNLEGRLKNAIEGLGIGLTVDGVLHSIRWLRRYRAAKAVSNERQLADTETLKPKEPEVDAPARAADEVAERVDPDLDVAAREAIEGNGAAESLHTVAARRLKSALNADPAKLRAVRELIDAGKPNEAYELIDFNAESVDWDQLKAAVGEGGDKEFIRVINAFSEVFETEMKSAKGFQPLAETLARGVGATVDDVLKLGRDVKGGIGLAARMSGADSMLYASTQRLRQLAKQANKTNADQDMLALFTHMDTHAALQATIKGSKSEIARALHAMRKINTNNIDEFAEFDAIMRDTTGMNGEFRRHLAQRIADMKDMNQINTLVRKSRWRRGLDVAVEVYINGLLSSISTLMLNNASNTLKVIEGISERYFAAGLGTIRNGVRRTFGLDARERITFREANAFLYGTVRGFDAAVRIPFGKLLKGKFDEIEAADFGSTWRAFKDEKPFIDTRMRVDADTRQAIKVKDESEITLAEGIRQLNLSKVDLNAKAINTLGKLIRIPGRLILTSDEFFKQIAYNQELYSRAYKAGDAAATAKGKTGKQRLAIIERMSRDYADFPPEDVRFGSMDFARYQTFQSDLPNGLARDIENVINRHPMLRFVVPFYRTPVNIVKQTVIERTPLPFIKAHKSEIVRRIAAGGPEGDIALARMATGSIFIGWAMNQTMSGNITGGGLSTTLLPNSERLDDIPPYSVRIGDTWYQYNRLEPLGMLMGLASDLATAAEWWEDEDDSEFIEAASLVLTVITSNVTDKTWFRGVADLVSALEDPKRYLKNYGQNLTTTMVTPYSSLLRRINVEHDEIAREAWTWMDRWKASVPGFSDDVPIRYDLLGQPVKRQDYLGPAWMSPVASGVERDDPVYRELARLEFYYRKPAKDLFGVGDPVDAATFSDVMRRKGEVVVGGLNLHDRLDSLINSGFYLDMLSDDGKGDAVKGIISSYLRAAKADFLRDNPEYFDDVREQKRAIGQLSLQQFAE